MNLENWLATATENLAPKAVTKVREDISMHVETAVNRYQLERHSELEALDLAVDDLGDAKIAARGFEKAYLTNKELDGFSSARNHGSHQLWISLICFGIFIFSVQLTLGFPKISWIFPIFILCIGLLRLVDYLLIKILELKKYSIFKIFLSFFECVASFMFLFQTYAEEKNSQIERLKVGISIRNSQFDWKYLILIAINLLILFSLWKSYEKWRKMRFL
jgi:hypothetical protein